MKLVLTILLAAAAAFLGYLLIDGIRGPIYFTQESEKRYEVVADKLEIIKEAQDAYLKVKGYFADNWDSLIYIINTDSLNVDSELKVLIAEYESMKDTYGPHLKEEYGDTLYYKIRFIKKVSIKDSLFKDDSKFPLASIKEIPFSDGKHFHIGSTEVSAAGGRYTVPVYHVTAPNKYILAGLDKQFFEPDHGYELGSLYQPNTEAVLRKDPIYYPED